MSTPFAIQGADQGDDRTRRTQLLITPDLSLGVSTRMYPMELGKFQRRSEGDILRLTEASQKPLVAIWPDFIVKPGTPNDDNA